MQPSQIVQTLDPPTEAVIKREDRTLVWRERRPDGTPTVVKLYRKRSGLSALRARTLRFRAEREFRRLTHLRRWGVPCTEPLAWAQGHSREHAFHEVLVMREVPNAVELGECLGSGAVDLDLLPLFRIVRQMHESGFCHQALYARNVLVDSQAPAGEEFFLADVPRSWTFPRSTAGTPMAWWDLLDLVVELEEIGVPVQSDWLDAYGLCPAGRTWWDAKRSGAIDPREKRIRLMRDGAARLRWGMAWGAVWRSRARPQELNSSGRSGS